MIPEQNSMLWRIDCRGRYVGQDIVNTFEYIGGDFDGLDVNAVNIFTAFTAGINAVYPQLLACMVDAYVSRQIIVYRESANPARRYAMYFPVSDDGEINENGLPPQVSAVIIRRALPQNATGLKGRLYLGCVPGIYTGSGIITDGTPYATALTELARRMASTQNVDLGAGRRLLIFPMISTARRKVQPAGGVNWSALTQVVPRLQLGNQRRRCPGHGRRG